MNSLLVNYYPILIFLVIAGGIAVAMVGGSAHRSAAAALPRKTQRL